MTKEMRVERKRKGRWSAYIIVCGSEEQRKKELEGESLARLCAYISTTDRSLLWQCSEPLTVFN